MTAAEFLQTYQLQIETIYTLIVLIATSLIYLRARKLYMVSLHKGIKYFSYAFLSFIFLYGVRYVYILTTVFLGMERCSPQTLLGMVFVFLIIYPASLAGFYLFYSLVWQRFEEDTTCKKCFYRREHLLLHIIAIAIALIEVYLGYQFNPTNNYVLFAIQLFLLPLTAYLCYQKVKHAKHAKQRRHLSVYLVILVLVFLGYATAFIGNILTHYVPGAMLVIYAIMVSIFLLLLRQVMSVTKQ